MNTEDITVDDARGEARWDFRLGLMWRIYARACTRVCAHYTKCLKCVCMCALTWAWMHVHVGLGNMDKINIHNIYVSTFQPNALILILRYCEYTVCWTWMGQCCTWGGKYDENDLSPLEMGRYCRLCNVNIRKCTLELSLFQEQLLWQSCVTSLQYFIIYHLL